MRVLVTGANGQLGREVVKAFAAFDHNEVVSCARADLDLTSRDSVFGVITTTEPDAVVHCGAYTAVDQAESDEGAAFAVNAMGTRHVVQAAQIVGAHVVNVSTDYIFDGRESRPYKEWDRPNPLNVYGHSKLAGERECRPTDAVVRTSWVFGRYGSNIVSTLLKLGTEDEKSILKFVNDQHGKPTCAEDLAQAIYQLTIQRLSGVYHLTNEGETTWFDFAQEIFRAAGFDPERITPIATGEMVPARPAIRPSNSVLENFAWSASGFTPLKDHRDTLGKVVKELFLK